jgi:gliding motility-associated-like protein
MKYLHWYIVFILLTFAVGVRAQIPVISNGDGSPLTTKYCRTNMDYEIKGAPSGGTFSGCGIFIQNGKWYFNPVTATQNIVVFPYQCSFTYTVNGVTTSKNILIWKPVSFSPPLKDSSTCNGQFFLHGEMLYAGDYDYQWSPAEPLDEPDSINTAGHISATQTFIIMATDVTSGCMGMDTVVINLGSKPVLSVSRDTIINARKQIQLHASGADNYVWSPAQWLSNDAIATPIASPQAPITYQVIGTTEGGCSDTAEVHIDIYKTILIPNAFSPNGDGLNDLFSIQNFGYQVVKDFEIFNRWGQIIFQTRDGVKGWDGMINGQPADCGYYFYQIKLQLEDNSIAQYKGDIMLMR